jgi:hypothetical protein
MSDSTKIKDDDDVIHMARILVVTYWIGHEKRGAPTSVSHAMGQGHDGLNYFPFLPMARELIKGLKSNG